LLQVKDAIRAERRNLRRQEALLSGASGNATSKLSRSESFDPSQGLGRGDIRRSLRNTGTLAAVRSSVRLPSLSLRQKLQLQEQNDNLTARQKPQEQGPNHRDSTVDMTKVHIRDLSWNEKEMVLRVLFAKLNESKAAKALHSVETQQPVTGAIRDLAGAVGDTMPDGAHAHTSPFFVSEGAGILSDFTDDAIPMTIAPSDVSIVDEHYFPDVAAANALKQNSNDSARVPAVMDDEEDNDYSDIARAT
jgi:hypothetical protein